MGDDVGAGGPSRGPTRRRVLAGLGAAAAGSLAGCAGGGETVAHASDVFGYPFPYATENVQLNPWLSGSYPWDGYTMFFEVQSVRAPGSARQLGDVVADLAIDGRHATVEYSDEYTWWNGEPVTARDQWVFERIQSAVGDGDRPAVELADEYTLVYEFDRALDEPLVKDHVVGGAINTPAWRFGQWVDRLEGATTDAAREAVVEDLRNDTVPLDEAMEEGIGCGPYELSEVAINRLMLERFADHPRADELAIPRLWFPVAGAVSTEGLIATGRVDGGGGLLDRKRGSKPDFLEQLSEFPTTSTTKLAISWQHPHLARRGVRRAVLATIPVDQVVTEGEFGEPTATQTGMASPADRRWLDADTRDDLREYPIEADPTLGAEFMREAGYTREDGTWYGPDGESVQLRLRSPTWNDWRTSARYVDQALRNFGFDVDFTGIPDVRLVSDVESRNYDLMLWAGAGRPFDVYDVTATSPTTLGYGVSDPATERTDYGKPVSVSVPRADGDGSRSVNLVELWRRLSGQSDRATTADAIATFARWWNHALPDVYLATGRSGTWGNTRDFEWTGDGETYRTAGPENRAVFHALKRGAVRPAGE